MHTLVCIHKVKQQNHKTSVHHSNELQLHDPDSCCQLRWICNLVADSPNQNKRKKSSREAERRALHICSKQSEWLKSLLYRTEIKETTFYKCCSIQNIKKFGQACHVSELFMHKSVHIILWHTKQISGGCPRFNFLFSFTHSMSHPTLDFICNSLYIFVWTSIENVCVLFVCPRPLLVNCCCHKFDTNGVSCIYHSLLNNCCRSGYFMVDSKTEIITHEHILQYSTCSTVVTCA